MVYKKCHKCSKYHYHHYTTSIMCGVCQNKIWNKTLKGRNYISMYHKLNPQKYKWFRDRYRKTKKGQQAYHKANLKYWKTQKFKEANRRWYIKNKEKINKTRKRYRKSLRGKLIIQQIQKKYQKSKKGRLRERLYRQTENWKLNNRRQNNKWRQKGFNILINNPFPNEIRINWHHINDMFVVPIPEQTHRYHYASNNVVKHRQDIDKFLVKIGFMKGLK